MKHKLNIQLISSASEIVNGKLETAIQKLLEKYNPAWVKNEHLVEPEQMSDEDHLIYNSLYTARDLNSQISGEVFLSGNKSEAVSEFHV